MHKMICRIDHVTEHKIKNNFKKVEMQRKHSKPKKSKSLGKLLNPTSH